MARGVNKVILVGNLGNDPEMKYNAAGACITRASLATSTAWKDRDGNQQERTEWHRVVFFGKLGEIAGEYLRKGAKVYVEGSIRYGKYTDSAGVERYTTDIVAGEMQMLDSKPANDNGAPRERHQPQPQESKPREDFPDDDIPF